MDPPPPTAPPATPQQQHPIHHHARTAEPSPNDAEFTDTYNEKDVYTRRDNARGSKGSRAGHDSVISHPFSPKASSPPSPSSSISSIGRKHRSIDEIQFASPVIISAPPKARLSDAEKAQSSRGSRTPNRVSSSNPDVAAAVYNAGDEKGPEEKAVQLLVRAPECVVDGLY
jgi:hypothetical protein